MVDNKLFWKNAKHFLSDKASGKDAIYLTENNKLVKTDLATAEVLTQQTFQQCFNVVF